MHTLTKDYKPSPTSLRFHNSDAFFRLLLSGVGMGKTVACVNEMLLRIARQKPDRNGRRRSRWIAARNTYPDLLQTTVRTFEEWVPPSICRIVRGNTLEAKLRFALPDKTTVESDVIFLSLDSPDDVRKLKSLDLTGAFLNEVSTMSKDHLDMLTTRLPRFPPADPSTGEGASWWGIIADSNPPDDSHWLYKLMELERPEGYELFRYPPALVWAKDKDGGDILLPNDGTHGIPAAENVNNYLGGFSYWLEMARGKSREFIEVYIMGEYGRLFTGKPVYSDFSPSFHISKVPLKPYRGLRVVVGFDFGRTPAAVFCQLTPSGQVVVLDELTSVDSSLRGFLRSSVLPLMRSKYAGMQITGVGDPAGIAKDGNDGNDSFSLLAEEGIQASPAPTNRWIPRREAVTWFLTRMVGVGVPGFLIDPEAKVLIKGFTGSYCYRKMRTEGGDRYTESADKTPESHPHDALQYACLELRAPFTSQRVQEFLTPRREISVAGWESFV